MGKVICPECGSKTTGIKFCTECGALLNRDELKEIPEEQAAEPVNEPVFSFGMSSEMPKMHISDAISPNPFRMKVQPNTTVSDEGLTMLVDCCRKSTSTVGGNGYREYVLYQRDEETYELHFYSKSENSPAETHWAYRADKSIVEAAYEMIDELKLYDYRNFRGDGMMGSIQILKYRRGDEIISITTDNLPMNMHSALYRVQDILTKAAQGESI